MNVGELVEKLQKLPYNAIVTLSSDAEGNRLRTAYGAGIQWYEKFEGHGDYLEAIHEDDLNDYDEDDYVMVVEIW